MATTSTGGPAQWCVVEKGYIRVNERALDRKRGAGGGVGFDRESLLPAGGLLLGFLQLPLAIVAQALVLDTIFLSAMFCEYSEFFRTGLLSPPSSSPASIDEFDLGPRRGSLPTDSPPSYADDASMFYFTLQPRRDKDQFRSFLSLDLAESLSLRSHSMKRSQKRYSREPPFAVDFQIPDSPSLLPPPSPQATRKSSPTTSLRALPSPKPAPVSSLPNVPSTPRSPALDVRVSRTPAPVTVHLAPAPGPRRKPSNASQATRASATTSTVSTRYRRTRRSKALACLEGRRPPAPPSGNFMSLSEDEDEDEDDEEEDEGHASEYDLSLSDDQLIMLIARLDDGDLRSAPLPPAPQSAPARVTVKPKPTSSRTRASSSGGRRRKTSLVLKSFMDFHNDEDTSSRWSLRSFIEVAT
ncbi:hypothetical protein C8R44DRAFT_880317 [Mycena epipterygia]|nr:hypothetical protein C8R44DRAFT_880317 [Mycena epipterygia]